MVHLEVYVYMHAVYTNPTTLSLRNEKVMNIISKCNTHSDTLAVNSDMHVVCSCATAFDNVCMHMDVACHIHINKMRVSGHCGTHPISKSHTTFNL